MADDQKKDSNLAERNPSTAITVDISRHLMPAAPDDGLPVLPRGPSSKLTRKERKLIEQGLLKREIMGIEKELGVYFSHCLASVDRETARSVMHVLHYLRALQERDWHPDDLEIFIEYLRVAVQRVIDHQLGATKLAGNQLAQAAAKPLEIDGANGILERLDDLLRSRSRGF